MSAKRVEHDRSFDGEDNRPADFYVEHDGERHTLSSLHAALDYFAGCVEDVDCGPPRLIDHDGKRVVAIADWDGVLPGHVEQAESRIGAWVYRRISDLMNAEAGTPEAAELEYLAGIVEPLEAAGDRS